MHNEELITDYVNGLVEAVQSLGVSREKDHVQVPLGDIHNTVLSLRFWSQGHRVAGRIWGDSGQTKFELRILPRHLEFRHPAVGQLGVLRTSVRSTAKTSGPIDVATRIANLARRLQHFSILKCVGEGLREKRKSEYPLAS